MKLHLPKVIVFRVMVGLAAVSLMVTGCSTDDGSATTSEAAVETTSPSIEATTTTPMLASELLTIHDLPSHSAWAVFDEASHEGEYVGGWNIFEHGVLAVTCEPAAPDGGVTAWQLDPGPQRGEFSYRFDDALFRAMYVDGAVVGEALYADTPETVREAFDTVKNVTFDCLEDDTAGFGTAAEASEFALPPVGDDAIAIEVTLPLSWTKDDLFRTAIVRDGSRLLIIEEHETVNREEAPRVSDDEFTHIVETATSKLDT